MAGRWDPCVSHRGAEIDGFVDAYFTRPERRILLVGGAGFDPRSTAVARRLANTEGQIRGLFLQEERPKPTQALIDRATTNGDVLRAAIPAHEMALVNIFGSDGAVVGGRNAVGLIGRQDFAETTDVVVDITTTGSTLRANLLKVLGDGVVLKSQACLVASKKARDGADEALLRDIAAKVSALHPL